MSYPSNHPFFYITLTHLACLREYMNVRMRQAECAHRVGLSVEEYKVKTMEALSLCGATLTLGKPARRKAIVAFYEEWEKFLAWQKQQENPPVTMDDPAF